jgi:spore coat polysaccharide biosynthesis protein SpsF
MSSTRFPGKSLADIAGEPSLALLVRRLERAKEIDRVVVATSTEEIDDPVARVAAESGCAVHRGPRDDVLTRFVEAGRGHDGPLVRITADCPLIDPGVVDDVVRLYERNPGAVYASNLEPRTFPVGLDTEVISIDALRRIHAEARDPSDREHVTLMARRDSDRFPRVNLEGAEDLSQLRWTVDYPEDLEFVRRVVDRLGDRCYEAGLSEILEAVHANPSLAYFHGRRG